jgi:hypothetical protein
MRLARATGTGVDYWMGLPLMELLAYMLELAHQLEEEKAAIDRAQRR